MDIPSMLALGGLAGPSRLLYSSRGRKTRHRPRWSY